MIKKDKIFELKIEEDDDVSGIDSISLVDEPAIEVNWMFFNKVKPEEFVIPDGQDLTYSEMITQKGQLEEELFSDGWERVKEDFVSSSPNQPSFEDTQNYLIRYKYILNPQANGAPVIDTTREFCRDLLSKNLVYRVEDLESIINDLGSSAMVWRGSYNCRHIWEKITYHRGTEIVNKSSVRKGRVEGDESLDVMGMPQPDTRTSNPSFGKQSFEKISIDYDDTLSTDRGKELAKRLLSEGNDLSIVTRRQESDLGPVLKVADELGIAQNKVHATNGKLKWETIKRLGIQRHIDNNPDEIKAIKENLPNVNAEQFDYNVGNIGGYVDPGVKKKKKPILEKSLVEPTLFDYLKPNEMSKQYFQIDNEEKRIVLGPAMIPDMKIFRKDSLGNPYYVYFSAETIKMIAEKYMRNKYTDNNDQMHDGKAVKDVYVIESWIKEDESDKSSKYGYESTPIGTWFVSMKVKNEEIWKKVKDGQLNGFSVSGFFEEVSSFTKEEMFLYKVAEILKKY
jgi:hypothetical protein